MDNAYYGEIRIFCGNYAPLYWEFCWGQKMNISGNQALYAVIGNLYGGTLAEGYFQLPDLRGLVPVASNNPSTGNNYYVSQVFGRESYSLPGGLIAHTHTLNGVNNSATLTKAGGNYFANSGTRTKKYTTSAPAPYPDTKTLNTATLGPAGNQGTLQPISNVQPYLPMNFIICTEGYFPVH